MNSNLLAGREKKKYKRKNTNYDIFVCMLYY